jgi:hypothetical protein
MTLNPEALKLLTASLHVSLLGASRASSSRGACCLKAPVDVAKRAALALLAIPGAPDFQIPLFLGGAVQHALLSIEPAVQSDRLGPRSMVLW